MIASESRKKTFSSEGSVHSVSLIVISHRKAVHFSFIYAPNCVSGEILIRIRDEGCCISRDESHNKWNEAV